MYCLWKKLPKQTKRIDFGKEKEYFKVKEVNMKHIVSTKILQEILNYLANRPYTEVATLIKALQDDVKPVEEEEKSE